jgi:hypothetical protein
MGGRKPFLSIKEIVHASDFNQYPLEEQEQFLNTYSRLGGSEVVEQLGSMASQFYLFGSHKKYRGRMIALNALVYNQSDDAERMLLSFARSHRRWLRDAAISAIERRRKMQYDGGMTGEPDLPSEDN